MFDTAKVQQMPQELEKFSHEHDNIYIIPEFLSQEVVALFNRFKISFNAIISDRIAQKEIFGLPVLKTSEAISNFNERTGIILLSQRSLPMIRMTLDFTLNGWQIKIPTFAISQEEISVIYDRLTILKILQQYQSDGLPIPPPQELAEKFARGLTTFLNPDTEDIKIQFWDRNNFVVPKYDISDTAIVLRGQIVYENSYTEKTCEFYRSIYPDVPIVVSTWQNEISPQFREACKKNSVVLLENIQPTISGFGHLNYQLENALQGVNYVKENLGMKFTFVTRTDQRLNRFDFLLYFRNLIQEFPPVGDKLQGRILSLGAWLTNKYLPFSSTDFFTFGFTSDIFKFYDLPRLNDFGEHKYFISHMRRFYKMREILSHAGFATLDFEKHRRKIKNFNMMMNRFVDADIFWMKNFYRKYIAPIEETRLLETWWKFIQEYLIFVDAASIIFDWSKYENNRRYATAVKGIDFSQWLDLYRNFNAERI